jgi:hypothetical protein
MPDYRRKNTSLEALLKGFEGGQKIGGASAMQYDDNVAKDSRAKTIQQMEDASRLERTREEAKLRRPHEERLEHIMQMNADTNAGYRSDQGRKMEEDARINKLKTLLGGGGADGKPLSNEAQKTSNLIDTARESINNTETLAKEHPYAYAAEQFLPNFVINRVGNSLGPLKDVADSKAAAKEAMQNVYTGAAATGEQVPAFQGFSGPGALDALLGKAKVADSVKDNLNTLQQGYERQGRTLTPEVLEAAELDDDPLAQTALEQQEAARAAKKEQKLRRLNPNDRALYDEISANPSHPNAAKAKQDLERKYGRIF